MRTAPPFKNHVGHGEYRNAVASAGSALISSALSLRSLRLCG